MGCQPPTENQAKGEVSDDEKLSLDKFKSLAKGLFGVAREDLREAENQLKDRNRKSDL